jgi:hypothetical protein
MPRTPYGLHILADRVLLVQMLRPSSTVSGRSYNYLDDGLQDRKRDVEPIVRRKRHVAVGTKGRLLMVNFPPVKISDSARAQKVREALRQCQPWFKHLLIDSACDRAMLTDKASFLNFAV